MKKLSRQHRQNISRALTGRKQPKTFSKKNSFNNQGSKNTFAVLNEEIVLEIREFRKSDGYTYLELAEMFNVSKENVGLICRRQTWKHI